MRDYKGRWIRGSTPHKVCFECRVSFKEIEICPNCRHPLINTGPRFKAPRRHNLRDWKRLHLLYLAKRSWDEALTPREAKQILEDTWISYRRS